VSNHPTPEEAATAFEAGMDDYVSLPLHPREFSARLRIRLRQPRGRSPASTPVDAVPPAESLVVCDDLTLDLARCLARRGGLDVHLRPREWAVLRALIDADGQLVTHQALFDQVWAGRTGNAQHHLRVHVASIRRKIELDPPRPKLIVTHCGMGYRYAGPPPTDDRTARTLAQSVHERPAH
jgi:two-component system KDP operon response regulator KdpE